MPARILVVDDDPLNAELICKILRSAGIDASFLTSSTEAAARLKREKYHAVFLDMRMPTPDGAELARQIRVSHVNSSPNAFSPRDNDFLEDCANVTLALWTESPK